MPMLKFILTRPHDNIEFFHTGDNVFQVLKARYSYEERTFVLDDLGLTRGSEFTFETRDVLNSFLNDPDRWAKRAEANAYNTEHGIITRVAVLDGENSGSVGFDSVNNTYIVTSMSEAEAEAWVTGITP